MEWLIYIPTLVMAALIGWGLRIRAAPSRWGWVRKSAEPRTYAAAMAVNLLCLALCIGLCAIVFCVAREDDAAGDRAGAAACPAAFCDGLKRLLARLPPPPGR